MSLTPAPFHPVYHRGSSIWMVGRIEDHYARPLSEHEVEAVCLRLNKQAAPAVDARLARIEDLLNANADLCARIDVLLMRIPVADQIKQMRILSRQAVFGYKPTKDQVDRWEQEYGNADPFVQFQREALTAGPTPDGDHG